MTLPVISCLLWNHHQGPALYPHGVRLGDLGAGVAVPMALGLAACISTESQAQLCGAFCAGEGGEAKAGQSMDAFRSRSRWEVKVFFYREKKERVKLKSWQKEQKSIYLKFVVVNN